MQKLLGLCVIEKKRKHVEKFQIMIKERNSEDFKKISKGLFDMKFFFNEVKKKKKKKIHMNWST